MFVANKIESEGKITQTVLSIKTQLGSENKNICNLKDITRNLQEKISYIVGSLWEPFLYLLTL